MSQNYGIMLVGVVAVGAGLSPGAIKLGVEVAKKVSSSFRKKKLKIKKSKIVESRVTQHKDRNKGYLVTIIHFEDHKEG